MPDDVNTRKITVNQRTPATDFNEIEINLDIQWNGFEGWSNDDFLRVMRTSNKEEITEHAAIAVMCLLTSVGEYEELAAHLQESDDILKAILNCLEASALTFWRRNEHKKAIEACNRAIAIASTTPNVWTMRGLVSYPAECSLSDFDKAVQLGENQYFPYYYLAHASLMRDDLDGVVAWCEKAFQHNPSSVIEAQLQKWLASAKMAQKRLKSTNSLIKNRTATFKIKVAHVKDSVSQKWTNKKGANCNSVVRRFDELSRKRDDSVSSFASSAAL